MKAIETSECIAEYIHMALLDVLDPLIDVVSELLPDTDAQLPLQILRDLDLVSENVSQCLNLFLDLKSKIQSCRILSSKLSGISRLTLASSALHSAFCRSCSSKDRP